MNPQQQQQPQQQQAYYGSQPGYSMQYVPQQQQPMYGQQQQQPMYGQQQQHLQQQQQQPMYGGMPPQQQQQQPRYVNSPQKQQGYMQQQPPQQPYNMQQPQQQPSFQRYPTIPQQEPSGYPQQTARRPTAMMRPPYIDPNTQIMYDVDQPEYEGWLTKQSVWMKEWRRRYFILKGTKLFFGKNAVTAPHGMMDLAICTTVKSADLKSKKRHSFEISTADTCYLLYADTEGEKDDWIGRVGKAIVRSSRTYTKTGGGGTVQEEDDDEDDIYENDDPDNPYFND